MVNTGQSLVDIDFTVIEILIKKLTKRGGGGGGFLKKQKKNP
jgi:hypothetical protein